MGGSLVEWGFGEAECASITEKQRTQIIFLCYTGCPTRAQDTQHKIKVFLAIIVVFLPLIPVGEITIISNDIDMVFY